MSKTAINIHHQIFIAKSPEVVWDYTQDYTKRTEWDSGVLEAALLQSEPQRIIKLRTKGNTTMTFVYKLDERPRKTSLVAKEIVSPLVESGGGSWTYEEQDGGTLWTQTNTIGLKKSIFLPVLLPLFRSMFTSQTKQAMKKAKKILEQ
jgi:hypothetical protein